MSEVAVIKQWEKAVFKKDISELLKMGAMTLPEGWRPSPLTKMILDILRSRQETESVKEPNV